MKKTNKKEEIDMPRFTVYAKQDCITCSVVSHIPAEDVAWLKERGLELDISCHKCMRSFDLTVEDTKWLQERGLDLVTTCRDCGMPFLISANTANWLLENDLKLFRRCSSCRQSNKEKKETLDFNLGLLHDETQEEINKRYDDLLLLENEATASDGE